MHIADLAVEDESVILSDLREMILPDARFVKPEGSIRVVDKLGLVVVLCSNSLHILDIERANLIQSLHLYGGGTHDRGSQPQMIIQPAGYSPWDDRKRQAKEKEKKLSPPFMQIEQSNVWSRDVDLTSVSPSGTILLRRRKQSLQPRVIGGYDRDIEEPNQRYYHMKIKEDVLVPYIRQHFPHDRALAMAIAGRAGLPGAEDLWIRSYPN